ncbi:MAG: exodeoxyribonuclease III [Caulobacterales bacterium]|nr:exodeoxyribonuclease III [Caulobacterales bacterium]
MTALTLASWNINSVRLRIDQVVRFAEDQDLDILCLQETKCADQQFPKGPLKQAGYDHFLLRGHKNYHGVAIVSKHPIEPLPEPAFCRHGHPRISAARVADLEIHNYYVPAGGDEPDPDANEKFAHKLDFVARMTDHFAAERARLDAEPVVLVGDLNIAPCEHDVWSHKQLLKVVSHTPVETDALNGLREAGGFTDIARALHPEPEKLFSWWSYRARDWKASNRGRRLDHIWTSAALTDRALAGGPAAFKIHEACRGWDKPSDHAPVTLRLEL